MEIRNLDKNLLYRICEALTQEEHCDGMPVSQLQRAFADLPAGEVQAALQTLVENGWLRWSKSKTRLHLTARGRSEIRQFIPGPLRSTCDPPQDCLS